MTNTNSTTVQYLGYYYVVDLSAIGQGFVTIPKGADTNPVFAYSALVDSYWATGLPKPDRSNLQYKLAPNPTSEIAELEFDIVTAEFVSVELIDLQGKVISTPFEGTLPAGKQKVALNVASLPSGAYLCKLAVGAKTKHLKLVKF